MVYGKLLYKLILMIRKFKHSNVSLWPIWLVNNELEPHIRFKKEYVKLFGVWFGKQEPIMNTFLTPCVQMFINAWEQGN
jgi:hypothetical protein